MNDGFLKTKEDIESWLNKYAIESYIINDDLTVDVDGVVLLFQKDLVWIPVKFGVVNGDFVCSDNKLSSLAFAPREVLGGFYCHNNKLSSLEFGPVYVKEEYNCANNNLVSLKHAPDKVLKGFYCFFNKLKSLEYCPQEIDGKFDCSNNALGSLKYGPSRVWSMDCSGNNLKSLKYCPETVLGEFNCSRNRINSLEFCPREIGGNFYGYNNEGLGVFQDVVNFEVILREHKRCLVEKLEGKTILNGNNRNKKKL